MTDFDTAPKEILNRKKTVNLTPTILGPIFKVLEIIITQTTMSFM